QRTGLAEHGLQTGIAGERLAGKFDRKIADIERVTDGDEANHQQKLHLIGREPKRSFLHGPVFRKPRAIRRVNLLGAAVPAFPEVASKILREGRKRPPEPVTARQQSGRNLLQAIENETILADRTSIGAGRKSAKSSIVRVSGPALRWA